MFSNILLFDPMGGLPLIRLSEHLSSKRQAYVPAGYQTNKPLAKLICYALHYHSQKVYLMFLHKIIAMYTHLNSNAPLHVSHLVGKLTIWFPIRYDTNQAVQPQEQARSLKFPI